jgi:hypothetical protein
MKGSLPSRRVPVTIERLKLGDHLLLPCLPAPAFLDCKACHQIIHENPLIAHSHGLSLLANK